MNRGRFAALASGVMLAWAVPAVGQIKLPSLDGESVAIAPTRDPQAVLRAELAAAEESLLGRLDRAQNHAQWRLQRLGDRRQELASQEQAWRLDLGRLRRKADDPRQKVLRDLLPAAQQLDRLLRSLEELQDARLSALLEASSAARKLQIELDADPPAADLAVSSTIDQQLRGLAQQYEERQQRLVALKASAARLEEASAGHRTELDEGLWTMLEPTSPPGAELRAEPDGAEPVSTPAEDEEDEEEEEARVLVDDLRRLKIAKLESELAVDRERLALVRIKEEGTRLALSVVSFRRDVWAERRAQVASREQGGVFNVTAGPFDPQALGGAFAHTRALAANPGNALSALRTRVVGGEDRSGRRRGPALLGLLFLLGVATVLLGRRVRPVLSRLQPRNKGDRLVLAALNPIVPLLPVTLVCGVLAAVGGVPDALRPLYRFAALAPPLVAGGLGLAAVLFPASGTLSMQPSVASYLRRLVRVGASLACAIGFAAALLPLLGYPPSTQRLVRAALGLWILLGWLGILLRKGELLDLLGARGDLAEVGVLRAGIRRFYRFFALGPLIVYILFAVGYVNLASLLLRGGLVTLSVLLLAPWVHQRLRKATEAAVGYPDGGGWLALSPDGARAAYRSIVPVLLVLVGGTSLALLAAGWDYSGDVWGNLAAALTRPLLDVGGSRITGVSLVLLALTIAMTFLVSRWVVTLLHRNLYPVYAIDRGTQTTLDTLVRYLVFGVGTIVGLDVVGVGIGFLTVFAGVIGIGLGFGSQTLAANFIAGLILLMTRQISVDDIIEVEGVVGRVARISSYATVVRTLDNFQVIVPNAKLVDGSVVNWTIGDRTVRLQITVGVAYSSDVALVRRLLLRVAQEDPRVLQKPPPLVRFDEFGDSALVFTLNPWIDDPEQRYIISSDLRFRITRAFEQEGVEIPFPQRDLHLRTSDETLQVALDAGLDVRDEFGEPLAHLETIRQVPSKAGPGHSS